MSAVVTPEPLDVAKLTSRVVRQSRIAVAPNAPRAEYGEGWVTSGARMVGGEPEDSLVIVDGSSRQAFPQSAVLTALMGDVIPRHVLDAVFASVDLKLVKAS